MKNNPRHNTYSKNFLHPDIFIIHKLRWNDININTLKNAFTNTCRYRNTIFNKEEALEIILRIANDEPMNSRWNNYKKRNKFVGDIEFKETIDIIKLILDLVFC